MPRNNIFVCTSVTFFLYFTVKKFKPNLKFVAKLVFSLAMFGLYWYWINQKLITGSNQTFGLMGFFLLICTATAYFPLPANLLVLGAVKDFDPLLVGFLGGVASLVAYLSEYLVFTLLFKSNRVANFKNTWIYKKVAPLFDKQKFFILAFASFLPIPSEPLRIYAITRKYPKILYMLSGFVGRFPRYFLLGYYGKDYVNSIWFIVAVVIFPVVFLFVIRGVYNITRIFYSRNGHNGLDESTTAQLAISQASPEGQYPEN